MIIIFPYLWEDFSLLEDGGVVMKEKIVQKQSEVTEIVAKMKEASSSVCFNYQGLTVEKFMKLRRELRANGCEVNVIKNNISRRAAKECGYEGMNDAFSGPTALVFSKHDAVAPAKFLFKFAKENEQLKVLKGVVNGDIYDYGQLEKLSQLPPYEVLLTQLAAGLLGTVRQLAVGLNMLVEKQA